MSDPRRCPYCGVPLAERDRVCFSCHRAIDRPASPAGDGATGAARPPGRAAQQPGDVPPEPRTAAAQPGRPTHRPGMAGPPEGDQSIELELIWGRDRRACVVPAAGATIGSTAAADIVVPAT